MSLTNKQFAEAFAVEIRQFRQFVLSEAPSGEKDFIKLSIILSKLLAFGEECPNAWADTEVDAPEYDRTEIEARIRKRFPNFGFYYAAAPNSDTKSQGALEINDAYDDVCEIQYDLNEVLWYFDNRHPELGLWQAKILFIHWGRHAINLKSYLHKRIHDD